MENTVLSIHDLTKSYGKEFALNHFDMTVRKGDIYGFVGQNGAGKTTTMKIILSLIEATSGSLALFGRSSETELRLLRERIGSTIESPSFYPYLSAHDNLTYYAKMKGITDKKAVEQALKTVGLENTGRKKFKNFSLGMKQRLGLSLAVLNNPDLLILDEPLNGLDPQGMATFRKTLVKLNQEYGVTILISSHILDELEHIATTYGFIHEGRMVEEISAADLQSKCGQYLLLKLEDADKGAFVLEQKVQTQNYKILDTHTIQLFDYVNESQKIISEMVTNQVAVKEVEQKSVSLENYYLNLIKAGGQANA